MDRYIRGTHCLEMNGVTQSGKVVPKVLANNEHFAATWLQQTWWLEGTLFGVEKSVFRTNIMYVYNGSLVPRLFPPSSFNHLQYTKTEGEGLSCE